MSTDNGVTSFERTLGLLTVRQYLYPHESVSVALVQALGVSRGYDAMLRTEMLDGQAAIGRLARKDLLRLARRLATASTNSAEDKNPFQQLVA